jgi:hypothetical protein
VKLTGMIVTVLTGYMMFENSWKEKLHVNCPHQCSELKESI